MLRAFAGGLRGVMPGVAAETAVASASGSGIWSRRRDEITLDRLQKVGSRGQRLWSGRGAGFDVSGGNSG